LYSERQFGLHPFPLCSLPTGRQVCVKLHLDLILNGYFANILGNDNLNTLPAGLLSVMLISPL
jgi:hypothetical protein